MSGGNGIILTKGLRAAYFFVSSISLRIHQSRLEKRIPPPGAAEPRQFALVLWYTKIGSPHVRRWRNRRTHELEALAPERA